MLERLADPEVELAFASIVHFTQTVIQAQEAQGGIQAHAYSEGVLEILQVQPVAIFPGGAPVRKDHALNLFHDGEAELSVEEEHVISLEIRIPVAVTAQAVCPTDPELVGIGQRTAQKPSCCSPQGQHVTAVLHFKETAVLYPQLAVGSTAAEKGCAQ